MDDCYAYYCFEAENFNDYEAAVNAMRPGKNLADSSWCFHQLVNSEVCSMTHCLSPTVSCHSADVLATMQMLSLVLSACLSETAMQILLLHASMLEWQQMDCFLCWKDD
jgi:hypothetical protein